MLRVRSGLRSEPRTGPGPGPGPGPAPIGPTAPRGNRTQGSRRGVKGSRKGVKGSRKEGRIPYEAQGNSLLLIKLNIDTNNTNNNLQSTTALYTTIIKIRKST